MGLIMTHSRHQGEETSDEKRAAQRYRSLCSRCDDGIVHSESRRGGDHSMISTSSFTHVGEPMPTPPSSSERLACLFAAVAALSLLPEGEPASVPQEDVPSCQRPSR